MPLTPDQKQEVADRLGRGEDVTLTLAGGDMETGSGGGGVTDDGAGVTGVSHAHSSPPEIEIPFEAVTVRLARRIGQLETDLAVAQAHAEAATAELGRCRQDLAAARDAVGAMQRERDDALAG
jgi:hypothetical protein